ncbi:MAG: hypothetical protein GX458_04935 [Phyllobacteriaceae bacterium]|nr:hypothetical protein [Phyllobacteriaceae bacterium]
MWDFACFAFAVALFGLAAVHAHRRGDLFPVPAEPPRDHRRPTAAPRIVAIAETATSAAPRTPSNVVFLAAPAAVAARRHG